jgi:5-(carboxyamino)imidazole ribonucleotide synthase
MTPGQWLGLLGGGQLGRMFCHAAQAMGYRVMVLDPDLEGPAASVADKHLCAAYDDAQALDSLADQCQAFTTEFENVPAQSLAILARRGHVAPGARAVEIAQDRMVEKTFIQSLGVQVAPHIAVNTLKDLDHVPSSLFPGILKASRLGYDGKGQVRVASLEQAKHAYIDHLDQVAAVLEGMVPFVEEISVVLARGRDGQCVVFPPARNVHHHGILAVSHISGQPSKVYEQAVASAQTIAEGLGYHGVLCVEFFVLADGQVVVNEIAPRPHNSGHYTQNACVTSQFEQQVRAMSGLPLGSTELLAPCVMLNILGDVWYPYDTDQRVEPDWASVLAIPNVSLHLYGKKEARPSRKMGHINVVDQNFAKAVDRANEVVEILNLPIRASLSSH